jgi:hypothetical protein
MIFSFSSFLANIDGFYGDADDDCTQFSPLRILFFAESFPSYTSGIIRRLKEIIQRLAKRGHYIYVITGCKVSCSIRKSKDSSNCHHFLRMLKPGSKASIFLVNI